MPQDRLFHPCLRNSAKVGALSWLGRAVWEDMVLGADDFGVLPNRPEKLRADNAAFLERETEGSIAQAVGDVLGTGLFVPFEHQRLGFLCDPRWQDFQKIQHPRRTSYPAPPAEVLETLSKDTVALFRGFHPFLKNSKKGFRQGRVTQRLTANGQRLAVEAVGGGSGGNPPAEPAGGPVRFSVAADILEALAQAPRFQADARLRDPAFWQAHIAAYPDVDFAREIREAQAWCVRKPGQAPKSDFPRFLGDWFRRSAKQLRESGS